MTFKDYRTKQSVVVVYTGNGKGKTSASIGLTCRALGRGWRVAYVQFIKHWEVGEHTFFGRIAPVFGEKLVVHKGGKGFYNAGDLSPRQITPAQHSKAAQNTYDFALQAAIGGKFDLVVCDEINNAVHEKLISVDHVKKLITNRTPHTSLCLTGRDFAPSLLPLTDIVTNMHKLKHHFDDKFLANIGIDY